MGSICFSCERLPPVVCRAAPPVQFGTAGAAGNGPQTPIHAKTLSFFNASRTRSIDFGQFAPMFRLDAARYRNAIS
jgi:hypothetical protein